MSHRAAVYMVRVRKKRDRSGEYRLLGDFAEQGIGLLPTLERYCTGLESISADEAKIVRCTTCTSDGHELRISARHGQNGVAADIVDADGRLRLRQTPQDTQLLQCGCLFLLSPTEELGWLAVHINNGRSVKGLLEKGLVEKFRVEFDELMLELPPFVQGSVLQEAVEHGQIDKVKLIRYEQPSDLATSATNRWVPTGAKGRLELDISAGRGNRVLSDLFRRYFGGDRDVFHEIVEFQGLTFDKAKVEVVLDGDKRRTFNIEQPDAGHAFTEDMQDLTIENGEPTPDSVFASLRSALANVKT
jgi:hypothetical protein